MREASPGTDKNVFGLVWFLDFIAMLVAFISCFVPDHRRQNSRAMSLQRQSDRDPWPVLRTLFLALGTANNNSLDFSRNAVSLP